MSRRKKRNIFFLVISIILVLGWLINITIDQQMRGLFVQAVTVNSNYTPKFKSMGQVLGVFYYIDEFSLIDKENEKPVLYCKKATVSLNPMKSILYLFNKGGDNSVVIRLREVDAEVLIPPMASSASAPASFKIPVGKELARFLTGTNIVNKAELKLYDADIHIIDPNPKNPLDEKFKIQTADITLDQKKYLHGNINITQGDGNLTVVLTSGPKTYDMQVKSSGVEAGGIVTYISYMNNNREFKFDSLKGKMDGIVSIYDNLGFDMDFIGKGDAVFHFKTFRDSFYGSASVHLMSSGLELSNIQGRYKQAKITGKGKITDWFNPMLDFQLILNDIAVDDLTDLVPGGKLPVKISGKLDSTVSVTGNALDPLITGRARSVNLSILDISTVAEGEFEATNDYVTIRNISAVQHIDNYIRGDITAFADGNYEGKIHISGRADELLAENLHLSIENLSAHIEMDIDLNSGRADRIRGVGKLSSIYWNKIPYNLTNITLSGDEDNIELKDIVIKNEKTRLSAHIFIASESVRIDAEGDGMSLAPFQNSMGNEDWTKQIDMREAVAGGRIHLVQGIQGNGDIHRNLVQELSGHLVVSGIGLLREKVDRIEADVSYKENIIRLTNMDMRSKTLHSTGNMNLDIKDIVNPFIYSVMHAEGNVVGSMFLQLRFGQVSGNVDANIITEGYINDLTYKISGTGEGIYSDFGFADQAFAEMIITKNLIKLVSLSGKVAGGEISLSGDIQLGGDNGNIYNLSGSYSHVDVKRLCADKRLEKILTRKTVKENLPEPGAVLQVYETEPVSIGFASGSSFDERKDFIVQLNREVEKPESLTWLRLFGGDAAGVVSVQTNGAGNLVVHTAGKVTGIRIGDYQEDFMYYDVDLLPQLSLIRITELSVAHQEQKEVVITGEVNTRIKQIELDMDVNGLELEDVSAMIQSQVADFLNMSELQAGVMHGNLFISGDMKKPDVEFFDFSFEGLKIAGVEFPRATVDMKIGSSGITARQITITNNSETNRFEGNIPFPFDIHSAVANVELHTQLANSLLKVIKIPASVRFDNVEIALNDNLGEIAGHIKLGGGVITAESLNLDDVDADISIDGDIITNIRARQVYKRKTAYIHIMGKNQKTAVAQENLALDIVSDPIYIDYPTMKGFIKLAGRLVLLPQPEYRGSIYINNGEFTTDKAKLPQKPLPLAVTTDVILDDTNSFVDDLINIRLSGKIAVSTEKRIENKKIALYPVLSGALDVSKGRIVFFTTQFNVIKGEAVFKNINKTEPTLDILAQSVIREPNPVNPQNIDEYILMLRITGIAPYYQMSYDGSTGPNKISLSKYEVEKILGGDIVAIGNDPNRVATKLAGSALRLQLLRGFEQSVEETLGLSAFQFNLNPSDNSSNNWDVNIYMSKQLFPRFFLIYSPTYSNSQNRTELGEIRYRLDDTLTIFGKTKSMITNTGSQQDSSYGLEYNILF